MKSQRQQQFIYLMDEQRQEIILEHHLAQAEVFIRIDFFFPMQMKTRHGNESIPPPPPLPLWIEGLASDLVTSEISSTIQMEWSESELSMAFYGSGRDGDKSAQTPSAFRTDKSLVMESSNITWNAVITLYCF